MKRLVSTDRAPNWIDLKRAGADAVDILRLFKIHEPPINVVSIAQALEVEVYLVDEPRGWSGAVDSNEKTGQARIFVDRADPPVRRRFTIAHELGHLLLHESGVAFRDRGCRRGGPKEIQANRFAAGLLMPSAMVKAYLSTVPTLADLADVFEVSREAMNRRFKELGIVRAA